MSRLDVARLREIAEGATPGPWFMDDTYATVTAAPFTSAREAYNRFAADDCWVVPESMDSGVADHNLAHIATFDPPTVLALLERLAEQEFHIRQLTESCDRAERAAEKAEARCERLSTLGQEWQARARVAEAAVERVRALAEGQEETHVMFRDIRAALDGEGE